MLVAILSKKWLRGIANGDAAHFHRTIKSVCDRHDASFYPRFKKWCDEYFYLPHRGEARGVGGIFYDYLGRDDVGELVPAGAFQNEMTEHFLEAYLPIVERRAGERWSEREREFQLLRRGRYVEFNLIYDRGTQFGLQTKGRAESILMSLPPHVSWRYAYEPEPGSREAQLLAVLREPCEWV